MTPNNSLRPLEPLHPNFLLERFLFSWMNLVEDADAKLAQQGFGRAHHRAMFLICRQPGITVGELISMLRITNQAVARVLKQLIQGGFIRQVADENDRRQRRLFATAKGTKLLENVSEDQFKRIQRVFDSCEPADIAGFFKVMEGLLEERDLQNLSPSIEAAGDNFQSSSG
ncbi:MAG: MarR family winged helix-turn-helix transcriptional regulator [Deferrisomatales bacterium]